MKSFFSLIQYCPDFGRREAANVGVLLLSPEEGRLDLKLISSNQRVRRFFGEEADNYQHLNAMKVALENRLHRERERLLTPEAMQNFIDAWANKLTFTGLRPVRTIDFNEDLEALYRELVAPPVRDLSIRAEMPLRARLDAVLRKPELAAFVRRDVTVEVPTLKREVRIPYGFQNGRFNLIQPGTLDQKSESRVETAACKIAVEGRSLFHHRDPQLGELQLVVVAEFRPGYEALRQKVDDIFQEYHVRLFGTEELGALEAEILAHGAH